MAQKLKPHCWQSKKKVQGERDFLRGLLANVYAKSQDADGVEKRLRKLHREDGRKSGT